MDFSLILVVLTAVAGLIWGLEVLYRKVIRSEAGLEPSTNLAVEYARSFLPVLLLVLVVRSFMYEPFRIPSSSMVPTLLVGDFIFVNKFTYGLRLPVVHSKILDIGEPERGDVMVFRLPSDPSVNYIKRLVGMPGDTVVVEKKRLYINNALVALERDGLYERPGRPAALNAIEQLGERPRRASASELTPLATPSGMASTPGSLTFPESSKGTSVAPGGSITNRQVSAMDRR